MENKTEDSREGAGRTNDPRAAELLHAEMKAHAEKMQAQAEEIRIRNAGRENPQAHDRVGITMSGWGKPYRDTLRERVQKAWHNADHEARKRAEFHELADLLQANPAVARILELIEATGV